MSGRPAIPFPLTPKLRVPNPRSRISQIPANRRRRCRRLCFRQKPLLRIDVLVSEFETVATRYFRRRLYILLADGPLPKSSRDRKFSELGWSPGEEEYEAEPCQVRQRTIVCVWAFFLQKEYSGNVGIN